MLSQKLLFFAFQNQRQITWSILSSQFLPCQGHTFFRNRLCLFLITNLNVRRFLFSQIESLFQKKRPNFKHFFWQKIKNFFDQKWQIFRSKKWKSRSSKKKRPRQTAKRKRKRNRGDEHIRSASRHRFSSDRRPINSSRFDLTTRARFTDAIELVRSFFNYCNYWPKLAVWPKLNINGHF